ncbi:hypothetical protein ACL03H_16360 [Saccharopolyspora sp. MS10]|uniref:hypothetical protein n=1 Tax=Saccharopolyspora sp. MS10 TaxID=3385973 RepID=UPI0039A2BA10
MKRFTAAAVLAVAAALAVPASALAAPASAVQIVDDGTVRGGDVPPDQTAPGGDVPPDQTAPGADVPPDQTTSMVVRAAAGDDKGDGGGCDPESSKVPCGRAALLEDEDGTSELGASAAPTRPVR